MEDFIPFESSKEHYSAQSCIIWCFDARFASLYDAFLAKLGFAKSKTDVVVRAGGAMVLAKENGSDKDDTKDQIGLSIKLHHTERIDLMLHMDCGGYGGSKSFNADHQVEWDHHVVELKKAAQFVRESFPEIKTIECWIADFDGAHRID